MANVPSGISVWSPKIRDEAVIRKFVALNGSGYVSIGIFSGTTPTDPDPGTIAMTLWFNDVVSVINTNSDPRGVQLITFDSTEILKADVGKYYVNIGPQYTGSRGILAAEWTYKVNNVTFSFNDYLQVLDQMPFYETLSEQERSVVEQATWMFADLYDSTEGGPHLIEEFQTHFSAERIAQLERIAVHRMNTIGYPITNFGVGPGSAPPPPDWESITVLGTYLEVVRHLMRSYTEIPQRPNMNVTYVDRSQYAQRWQMILSDEYDEWTKMVRRTKISMLGLGRSSILIAGGIYGGSARGIFQAGTYASQVRSWRFYPAAPAITWGATHH